MDDYKEIAKKRKEIAAVLRTIIDPEVEVNIVDLGLIYSIDYDGDKRVNIDMTLSTPACPIGDTIIMSVMETVMGAFPGMEVDVNLTFEPRWNPEMVSEEGKKLLA